MRQLFRFLIRNIPRHYLLRVSFFFSRILVLFYKGNRYECPVCGGKFRRMLPFGAKGNENRLCPKCLSLERHRLMWLYLKQKTDFFTARYKVLHIAPEQCFLTRFRKMSNLEYTTGDLISPLADVKMDITAMPFADNSFDVVFCNHVLEHIPDEAKALSEIMRVLKPGGWSILLVPIDINRTETYEDLSITDPKEREKHFGQYDHVRYHGLDYPKRLEKAGFIVSEERLFDELGKEKIDYYRLYKPGEDIIYVARKPKH